MIYHVLLYRSEDKERFIAECFEIDTVIVCADTPERAESCLKSILMHALLESRQRPIPIKSVENNHSRAFRSLRETIDLNKPTKRIKLLDYKASLNIYDCTTIAY